MVCDLGAEGSFGLVVRWVVGTVDTEALVGIVVVVTVVFVVVDAGLGFPIQCLLVVLG